MALIELKQISPIGNLILTGSIYLTGSVYITGNTYASGSATYDNLNLRKGFITLLSGSISLQDGGLILQYANGTGSAIYLSTSGSGTYGRAAVAYGVSTESTSVQADEYLVSVKLSNSAPTGSPTWGGDKNGQGNMSIDIQTGDLYIWF